MIPPTNNKTRCHILSEVRKQPIPPALKKTINTTHLIRGGQSGALLTPRSSAGSETKAKGRRNRAMPKRQLAQEVSQNSDLAMGIATNTAPATGGVIADMRAQ